MRRLLAYESLLPTSYLPLSATIEQPAPSAFDKPSRTSSQAHRDRPSCAARDGHPISTSRRFSCVRYRTVCWLLNELDALAKALMGSTLYG
jgi:hypothetical protein